MSVAAWTFVFLAAMSPLTFVGTVLATWTVRAAKYALRYGKRIGQALFMDGLMVGFGALLAAVSISLFGAAEDLPLLAIGLFLGALCAGVGLASSIALALQRTRQRCGCVDTW